MRGVIAISLTVMSLTLAGCERWALDRQMEEFCKKDGGITVYEKVTLPANYFENDGRLKMTQSMAYGADAEFQRIGDDEYRIITQRIYLVGNRMTNLESGHGVLTRTKVTVLRWKDKFLLGEQIWYARGGGDGFTFGFQPSGESCPFFTNDLAQLIFIKGN